jgi:hypothetical protein
MAGQAHSGVASEFARVHGVLGPHRCSLVNMSSWKMVSKEYAL